MIDSRYWIAFGDIHDDISRLPDIPELAGAAGVIITGDMTFCGGIKQAERALEIVTRYSPRILAQIGNMDLPEITDWLEDKDWNLHARARELFPGVVAIGLGGSPPTPFNTPSEYSESRLAAWMDEALAESARLESYGKSDPDSPTLILVSHTPPHATACDRLDSGLSVGSTAVRAFIEKRRPDICICGHIHESRAEDHLGKTHILNPGPLSAGGYVLLRLEEGGNGRAQVSAELRQLPSTGASSVRKMA